MLSHPPSTTTTAPRRLLPRMGPLTTPKSLRLWVSASNCSRFHHNFEERRPAVAHTPESIRKYSVGKDKISEELLESGFALADHDRLRKPSGLWEYLDREVEGKSKGNRNQEFAKAMQAAASASALRLRTLSRLGMIGKALGRPLFWM